MMAMKEPTISEKFDVDDIRKIREYNAERYKNMTTEEIISDTRKGAEVVLARLKKMKKTTETERDV